MGEFIRHTSCLYCTSSDGMAIYKDGTGHCFVCKKNYYPDGDKTTQKTKGVKLNQEKEVPKGKEPISDELAQEIKARTRNTVDNYRGISDETAKFYGLRGEYNEDDKLSAVYYPCTKEGKLVGYKKRALPKLFSGIGDTTYGIELFGQFRYKNKAEKFCMICEGEQDTLAAFQMLHDYNIKKGNEYIPVVVGISTGAQAGHKQVQANYAFFEQFTKVIIAMDQDEAGKEAKEKIAKALPRGKAFIFSGPMKDISEYLENNKEQLFLTSYFNAKPWTPASLHPSTDLYEEALKYVNLDKLALPSWLSKMNDMLAGGIPKGTLTLIAAASSVGKSTFLNQLLVDWIQANQLKDEDRQEVFAVLSLEATAGEYATQLISYYCQQKFINIPDRVERLKAMSKPEIAEKAKELFQDKNGLPTFLLCDDRGAGIDDVEEKIEEIIRSMGVSILLIDVTSDILSGLDVGRQEEFMAFQKRLVKETGVSIINVVHTRKASSGEKDGSRGAELTDSSIIGSSTLVKSAAIVIGLVRDKMAASEQERNTTHLRILKARHSGSTGDAGSLYYNKEQHRLMDLDEFGAEVSSVTF